MLGNGTIAKFEGYEADVPVTLAPEQAVEAGAILGATAVCAGPLRTVRRPARLRRTARHRRAVRPRRREARPYCRVTAKAVPLVTRRGGKAA
ncbi:hypothetical protein [Streptomyces sennicomposti]